MRFFLLVALAVYLRCLRAVNNCEALKAARGNAEEERSDDVCGFLVACKLGASTVSCSLLASKVVLCLLLSLTTFHIWAGI